MSRMMLVGGGAHAALIARVLMGDVALGVRAADVIIVDDSLPPSPGDDNSPVVMSTEDAKQVYILGSSGGRGYNPFASRFGAEALVLSCPEVFAMPTEQNYLDVPQRQRPGRHTMDRKQQSMQAKARRR